MFFFRESCFKQSGDVTRKSNPTHYRCSPAMHALHLWGCSHVHLEVVGGCIVRLFPSSLQRTRYAVYCPALGKVRLMVGGLVSNPIVEHPRHCTAASLQSMVVCAGTDATDL